MAIDASDLFLKHAEPELQLRGKLVARILKRGFVVLLDTTHPGGVEALSADRSVARCPWRGAELGRWRPWPLLPPCAHARRCSDEASLLPPGWWPPPRPAPACSVRAAAEAASRIPYRLLRPA